DSKQLHTAKAAAEGLMSAWIASRGFTGAKMILEGSQGLATGTSTDSDITRLTDGLGKRWCVLETSFKYHASCRHTHPAADALLAAMQQNNLDTADVDSVVCHVHQAAIDVLGPVTNPETVHQAKFCMAATLGLIATHGKAGLREFENVLTDNSALSFLDRVSMQLDDEVDASYPNKWIGKVTVKTKDGALVQARVNDPKGDPGNTLTREEIDAKARYLAQSSGAMTASGTDQLMSVLWDVRTAKSVPYLIQQESVK
ncbi:MAG: MmgE/PrpD family protein, partial [Pseudomonadota bacterium]